MKAKELMIGDLVYEGQDKVIKICRNYGRFISYIDELETKDYPAKTMHEVEETCLNPISLTEEILKLNGFIFKENDNEWWHYNPFPFFDFQIGYYNDDCNDMRFIDECVVTNIKLKYVHQLQHVLRLCGLDELADNFKIE